MRTSVPPTTGAISLPPLAAAASDPTRAAAAVTLSLYAEQELIKNRVIDLSLTISHQNTEKETLELRLHSLYADSAFAIEQLQCDCKAAELDVERLKSEVENLNRNFESEKKAAEKEFVHALEEHSQTFPRTLQQSQLALVALVDQKAGIYSHAYMAENLAAKIAEFERRRDEQQKFHERKCSAIRMQWHVYRDSVKNEHEKRLALSQAKYKGEVMKMNISYKPINMEIARFKREKMHEDIIVIKLQQENAEMQQHIVKLTLQQNKLKFAQKDQVERLYQTKVALKQLQHDANESREHQANIVLEYKKEEQLDNARRIREKNRADDLLHHYNNAWCVASSNVQVLRDCVEAAELMRSKNGFELLVHTCCQEVKDALQTEASVSELSASDRLVILTTLFSRLREAEERQRKVKESFRLQQDSLVRNENVLTAHHIRRQEKKQCDARAAQDNALSPTDSETLLPRQVSDAIGSFFLTQFDFDMPNSSNRISGNFS